MRTLTIIIAFSLVIHHGIAQDNILNEIELIQLERLDDGICPDFVRSKDLDGFTEGHIQQIFIIRHGEPAMNKKGWKNRNEAIRYTEMYDSVGVYDFDRKPICLRDNDIKVVYASKLPRAINTAEKTFNNTIPIESDSLFNEFERKIIKFPNVKLPTKFWSVTSRIVWMMGFNKKGIESFSQSKERARKAAFFLKDKTELNGKTVLFSHGFLNKYIKRYLKREGYKYVDLNGQKYLGAYYFYKIP